MKFVNSLPMLNLDDPTNRLNYVDREFVKGSPLNWRDDVTGAMCRAVMAYLRQQPTEEDLRLVIGYIQYHIHAPCWIEQSPMVHNIDDECFREIRELRKLSLTLKTLQDVNQYINRAIDIALDPF